MTFQSSVSVFHRWKFFHSRKNVMFWNFQIVFCSKILHHNVKISIEPVVQHFSETMNNVWQALELKKSPSSEWYVVLTSWKLSAGLRRVLPQSVFDDWTAFKLSLLSEHSRAIEFSKLTCEFFTKDWFWGSEFFLSMHFASIVLKKWGYSAKWDICL